MEPDAVAPVLTSARRRPSAGTHRRTWFPGRLGGRPVAPHRDRRFRRRRWWWSATAWAGSPTG